MQTLIGTLINGLALGMAYALIAVGYSMVFGVLRLINFSHGAVYAFGAYMVYFFVSLKFGLLPAILLSVVASGILALLIDKAALEPLRKKKSMPIATLITTIGMSFIIQNFLSIDTEWGQSAGNAMEENIKALGGNFALRQEVSTDAVDFATEVANFKAAGCDVVMVAGMYGTLAPFAVACKNSGYDVKLVGCSNAYTANLINIAGEAAEGIYAPVSFFAGNTDERVQAYVKAYTDAYGAAPSALTTQAYDSVGILLGAIERAGFDREAIKNEMYKTEYEGMSGYTTFDENGDAQKIFTKIMVKDGAFQLAEF